MKRNPKELQAIDYDVIVIGAGILGINLFVESSRRGFRTLLVEKNDYGSGSTLNSLRILHGGLRYLQSANIPRLFESVRERRWFCKQYPDMTSPLPCVLLLNRKGMRRPAILRLALAANDLLSMNRNSGLRQEKRLPAGKMLSVKDLTRIFPLLDCSGVVGGALWFDAFMTQPVRIVMELLRCGCDAGGQAANYVEAVRLVMAGESVSGICAVDTLNSKEYVYSAPTVINATGPWAGYVARRLGVTNTPDLPLSLAWNTLIRKSPIGSYGLVFTPPGGANDRSYVMVPRVDSMLIGTGQAPCASPEDYPQPTEGQLTEFISEINEFFPSLDANTDDISAVYSGLVPAGREGTSDFAKRPWIVRHEDHGGPKGFASAAAVKFTTARATAIQVLGKLALNGRRSDERSQSESDDRECAARLELARRAQEPGGEVSESDLNGFLRLGEEEAATTAEDLVFRRLGVTDDPDRAGQLIESLQGKTTC